MGARLATRVVSLVPSETESVAVLAGIDRLIGRTDYCHEPAGVQNVPSVGGTKKFDVAAVLSLAPDLILCNQEENGKADVEALMQAGAPVHLSFPRSLRDSRAYLAALAERLGVDAPGALREADEAIVAAREPAWRTGPPRVAALVWREPWMSFDDRTFASDILEAAGAINVFSGRPRRYPLAADLDATRPCSSAWALEQGLGACSLAECEGASPPSRSPLGSRTQASTAPDSWRPVATRKPVEGKRDTRYPRFALEELVARRPDVVLLPDEPYAFAQADADELTRALRPALPELRVAFVSGKDLFWYGVRAASAVGRLRSTLAALA